MPTLTLQEQWTDNFFVTETERTDNFRTTAAVGFDLLMNSPEHAGLPVHQPCLLVRFGGGRAADELLPVVLTDPSTTPSLPGLSLTVTDTFRRDDDPFLADTNGVRTERETFVSNTFSVSLNWLIDIFQTQYYYRNNLFLADDDNTISHILGGNVSVPLGAIHTLTGGYEFTYRDSDGAIRIRSATGSTDCCPGRSARSHRRGSRPRSAGTAPTRTRASSTCRCSPPTACLAASRSRGASGTACSTPRPPTAHQSRVLQPRRQLSLCAGHRERGRFQDFRQTADEGQDFGIVTTRSAYARFSYYFTAFITGSLFARTHGTSRWREGGRASRPRPI